MGSLYNPAMDPVVQAIGRATKTAESLSGVARSAATRGGKVASKQKNKRTTAFAAGAGGVGGTGLGAAAGYLAGKRKVEKSGREREVKGRLVPKKSHTKADKYERVYDAGMIGGTLLGSAPGARRIMRGKKGLALTLGGGIAGGIAGGAATTPLRRKWLREEMAEHEIGKSLSQLAEETGIAKCADCGCGCKPGKPAKGCKCDCADCKKARASVEKAAGAAADVRA